MTNDIEFTHEELMKVDRLSRMKYEISRKLNEMVKDIVRHMSDTRLTDAIDVSANIDEYDNELRATISIKGEFGLHFEIIYDYDNDILQFSSGSINKFDVDANDLQCELIYIMSSLIRNRGILKSLLNDVTQYFISKNTKIKQSLDLLSVELREAYFDSDIFRERVSNRE